MIDIDPKLMLLPLLVVIPLLGALVLMLVPIFRPGENAEGGPWRSALVNACITLGITLLLCVIPWPTTVLDDPTITRSPTLFNWLDDSGALQLKKDAPWISFFGLLFRFGVDAISMIMILLTAVLMPLIILASRDAIKTRQREFYVWLMILQAALFGTFCANDVLFFYLCFEATLVPLYFMIGIHGGTRRRSASAIFFIYTFVGSAISLAGLLYAAWWSSQLTNTWNFEIREVVNNAALMSADKQTWVMIALMLGFGVKLAVFPFHSWKPLSYEEAPTVVSAILGGLLLQLGLYGILRFVLPMTPTAVATLAMPVATLGVIGIIYGALIARVQNRLKPLIAYASISHVGFAIVGLFSGNAEGIAGAASYIINQGLITAALFLCVHMLQARYASEDMRDYSGLGKVMPVWASFLTFFALASVGVPGLNGFVGEFLSLLGAFKADYQLGPVIAIIAGLGIILAAIYVLYMVGRTCFGPTRLPASAAAYTDESGKVVGKDLTPGEIGILLPLAAACLLLGLLPNLILQPIEGPVNFVANRYGNPLWADTGTLPNMEEMEQRWQEDQDARNRLQLLPYTPSQPEESN